MEKSISKSLFITFYKGRKPGGIKNTLIRVFFLHSEKPE